MCIQNFITQQVNAYNEILNLHYNAERYLPRVIRQQWEQIINQSLPDILDRSNTYDDLCQELENLRIKGIGGKTIVQTAAELWNRYKECSPDDSCWCCFQREFPKMRRILPFVLENDEFRRLSRMNQINFLLLKQTDLENIHVR